MAKQIMGRTPVKEAEQLGSRPGRQYQMRAQPKSDSVKHVGSGKLKDKVALITGGDSGIGRAIALSFAKEGADVIISYLNEHKDAGETVRLVENYGRRALPVPGDIGDEDFAKAMINETVSQFGKLDILINNAGEQHPQEKPQEITAEQLEKTFRTNFFGMFFLSQAAIKHMKEGSTIINTTSVTAYKGHAELLDYSSSKGAVVAFTRSLSQMVADQGIRVNAVAPGPIWTPLIPSTFPADQIKDFGKNTPMGRPGQPEEVAPAYLFLASDDSSYITGQVIHVNGGTIVNS